MPDEPDNFVVRHNRRMLETFPELRGLPYELQLEHFQAARRSATREGGCLQALAKFAWNIVFAAVVLGGEAYLTFLFLRSRWNLGVSWLWLFLPVGLITLAIVGVSEDRKHRERIQAHLRRQMLWICDQCGRDLSTQTSRRCVCGYERKVVVEKVE
jgi:hypothetical protein